MKNRLFRAGFLIFAIAAPAGAKSRPAAIPKALKAALQKASRSAAQVTSQSPLIIDAGHGGNDWGATVAGRQEKDITLAVAKRLKEAIGSPARLTREEDVFIPLDQRIEASLNWSGAAFVSLHVNKVRSKSLQGITVYAFGRSGHRGWGRHASRRNLPLLPAPPKDAVQASAALAADVARSLRAGGFKVNQTDRAEDYVLKNPVIPSILIELGFLSNPEEAARLAGAEYQEKLALALAKSLTEHLDAIRPSSAASAPGFARPGLAKSGAPAPRALALYPSKP